MHRFAVPGDGSFEVIRTPYDVPAASYQTETDFDAICANELEPGVLGDILDPDTPPAAEPDEQPTPSLFERPIGPKLPATSPRTGELIDSHKLVGDMSFDWAVGTLIVEYAVDGRTEQPNIGGVGMTGRSLDRLNEELPGAREALLAETGKIVFLGNGYSLAPLEVLGKESEDELPEIVIVDAINYEDLDINLVALNELFDENLVEMPESIRDIQQRCRLLLSAADSGNIQLINHVIGNAALPEAAQNADLAINVFGPNWGTLDEQVKALKPGGKLYVNTVRTPKIGEISVTIEELSEPTGMLYGHIIRRV